MKYFLPILVFVAMLLPAVSVEAQGLVPSCQGPDCTACDLIALVDKVMDFLIQALSIIAVIMLVIAGFRMVTSGGDSGAAEAAKKSFTNIVVGILIVLAAWLIVDTLLNMLTKRGGLGEWVQINCAATAAVSASQRKTADNNTKKQQNQTVTVVDGSGKYTDEAARAQLADANISVWESSPGATSLAGINKSVVNEALYLKQNCNCSVTVTGGTESGHALGQFSHSNGYKIDLDDSPALTNYIKSQATLTGTRSDGAKLYTIAGKENVEYALENTHWDITVK